MAVAATVSMFAPTTAATPRAGSAVRGRPNRVSGGKTVGGDSIAQGEANGGDGGSPWISETPLAQSGDSGTAWAQSSATNTGNTGPATSTANASPTALSGDSGDSGRTGDAKGTLSATNTEIKGRVSVSGDATSGRSGDTGNTGDARADGAAFSVANSGALAHPTRHPAPPATRPMQCAPT